MIFPGKATFPTSPPKPITYWASSFMKSPSLAHLSSWPHTKLSSAAWWSTALVSGLVLLPTTFLGFTLWKPRHFGSLASWLQQVDRYLKEMGMGLASAWGMARRSPLEYRQKVDAVTCCSGACSHILPNLYPYLMRLSLGLSLSHRR